MRRFRDLPIRRKLLVAILASSGAALLASDGTMYVLEAVRVRRAMRADLAALGRIIAENSSAALAFDDEEAAQATLNALRARPEIESAVLYRADGAVLAHYPAAADPPQRPAEARGVVVAEPDALAFALPVRQADTEVGTLLLRSDLTPLRTRLRAQTATALALLFVSWLVAIAASAPLQRMIATPLLELAALASDIGRRRDYSVRARRRGEDEMGRLVDAFNDMLEEIQTRDQELQTAKDELERRVAERTAELAHRNEELARSNRDLDDFAYIASHDLKEPLRGLHNYARFLIDDHGPTLPEDARAKLETMGRLTRRMDALIDSLLYYSRVGRIDLAIREVDLNHVVVGVVDTLHISLEEYRVDVRVPRPLPVVRCDEARIGEVFRNLVANAMRFNDKSEKWVEIGALSPAEALAASNGHAPALPGSVQTVLYVKDNGIGIAPRHHEAVFRIFKRLHARDRYGGGTGAGLTIVKKIVERHQGLIWVDSRLGEGTTFYVAL